MMNVLQQRNKGIFMTIRNTPRARLAATASRSASTRPVPMPEIKPATADSGIDVWITALQAGEMLGIKGKGVYRLIQPGRSFMVTRRPLPRKILVSLRSVNALMEATRNPEFWNSPDLQDAYLRTVTQPVE
jgi:hypothetical protein